MHHAIHDAALYLVTLAAIGAWSWIMVFVADRTRKEL